jgi:hypothetical protein
MTLSASLLDIKALSGTWESLDLEPIPEPVSLAGTGQIFITRAFDFQDRTWRVRFSAWADKNRRVHLFDGVFGGTFELEDEWAPVPGARAAVFHFSRRLFTVHTPQLARQLSEAGSGDGNWIPGVQQDISRTGALVFPSVTKVGTEYDLVAFEKDPDGETELYLGDRSHEMNAPDRRPKKRIAWPIRRTA